MEQTYPNWELCLADDGSHDAALAGLLQQYSKRDARIRIVALKQNLGISGATNAALSLCTGEYAAFLDHDDEIAGFALSEVVQAINDSPDTELFYSDEDKLDEQGRRYDAFFKPDWSPDLFLSCNYICHFVVMKRSLVERLGGLDESYSGAQDYELLLRASERTGLGGICREKCARRLRGRDGGVPLSGPLSHRRRAASWHSDTYRRPQERFPGCGRDPGEDNL
jgi:glycosyltransferase involved in cell wall biosynthesis